MTSKGREAVQSARRPAAPSGASKTRGHPSERAPEGAHRIKGSSSTTKTASGANSLGMATILEHRPWMTPAATEAARTAPHQPYRNGSGAVVAAESSNFDPSG